MNFLKNDILTKMIKATISHASKKDVRYYLNGVYFKIQDKCLIMVGTDGHRLIELKMAYFNDYALDCEFILSHEVLKVLLAQLAASKGECAFKSFDGMKTVISINGNDFDFITIDGKYPDYTRVIKAHDNTREQPTSEYGLNVGYLSDIQKSCSVFKRKFNGVKLSIKDASTSIKWTTVLDEDNSITGMGLIMPMRM